MTPRSPGATGPAPDRERRRRPPDQRAQERSPDGGADTSPLAAAVLRMQHLVGNRAVRQLLDDGGAPLEPDVRRGLERFFGCDLSSVRIRTGRGADSLCDAVGGDAVAVGEDVVVRTDRAMPSPASARRLLAHEVAHVVQQREGPVEGTPGPEGVLVSERGDRLEQAADRAAERLCAGDA